MLKNERKAGAEVDSSTTADILPSASIAQTPMLGDVYEDILQLFVSDDDLRMWMTKPFIVGNKAVATDAHCLVSVPEWKGNYEYCDKTKDVYPKEYNCFKEIPLSNFLAAIAKVPLIDDYDEEVTETECDECDGEGEVDFEYSAGRRDYYLTGECPICEGEGTITTTKKTPNGKKVADSSMLLAIGSHAFNIFNVHRLVQVAEMLHEEKINLVYQKVPSGASMFKVGECEVLMMPCFSNNDAVCANIA